MWNRMMNYFVVTIIASPFLLTACAGTKLVDTWKDNTYTGPNIQNVLVIGVSDQYEKRTLFEEIFVRKFKRYGVNATSLTSVARIKAVTIDYSKAQAMRLGCDAIFTVQLISINEEEVIRVIYPPQNISSNEAEFFPQLITPSAEYNVEEKHYVMENNLYEASTGKLIWKGRSDTVNPHSMIDNLELASRAVMKNLHARKLIR
jgi:hypothetical protein